MFTASLVALSCAGEFEGNPNDYPCAFKDTACTPGASGAPGQGGSSGTGGGGGAGPGSGGSAPLPPDDPCLEPLFSTSCASFCHKPGVSDALGESLNLTGGNYGVKMAGVPATYRGVAPSDMSKCKAGALLIDPANNAESVLLKKVTAMQACGSVMPIGSTTGLAGDQLACITRWVNAF